MSTPARGCVTFLGPPEHTAVDWAQHSRASMSHGSRGLRLRLQWRQGELLLRPKGNFILCKSYENTVISVM